MHILTKLKMELKAAVEAGGPSEETFYKEWNEGQRKQYITEHPDSKYAQEKNGSKPSVTKPTKNNSDEKELLDKVRKSPKSIKDIKNPPEKAQLIAVKRNPQYLGYIDNPTEAAQMKALERCHAYEVCDIFNLIKNPTEAAQMKALEECRDWGWDVGDILKSIKNPSEAVQMKALERNGSAIEYIKNPTDEMKRAAIKSNGKAIKFIENPSKELQMEAIKNSGETIQYIKNPSEEMKWESIKNYPYSIKYIENPTDEMKWAAIRANESAIDGIKNPTEEMQLEVIKNNPLYIGYIDNPTEEVQMKAFKEAVKKNKGFDIINSLKNPSDKVQELYLKNFDGTRCPLDFIKNPSAKTIEYSIKGWGAQALKYLDDIPEETQLEFVKKDLNNIKYIKNPKGKVKQIKEDHKYLGEGRGDLGNDAEKIANALSKELPGEFEFDSYDAGSGYNDSIMTYNSPDGKTIDLTFDGYAMQWVDPDSGEMIHDGSGFDESAVEDIKNFLKTKKKSTRKSWRRDFEKSKNNLAF